MGLEILVPHFFKSPPQLQGPIFGDKSPICVRGGDDVSALSIVSSMNSRLKLLREYPRQLDMVSDNARPLLPRSLL